MTLTRDYSYTGVESTYRPSEFVISCVTVDISLGDVRSLP